MQPLVEVGATFAETTAVNNREQTAHCFHISFLRNVVLEKGKSVRDNEKGNMSNTKSRCLIEICVVRGVSARWMENPSILMNTVFMISLSIALEHHELRPKKAKLLQLIAPSGVVEYAIMLL